MDRRTELARLIAERTRRRFSISGGVERAAEGELNAFLYSDIRTAVSTLEDPFASVIKGWGGQAHQLDLTWWEAEETPEEVVYGLAGAILDFEVRQILDLPL